MREARIASVAPAACCSVPLFHLPPDIVSEFGSTADHQIWDAYLETQDARLFAILVQRHHHRWLSFAGVLVRNSRMRSIEACDLVQDALLALRGIRRAIAAPRYFVLRLIRWAWLRQLKRNAERIAIAPEPAEPSLRRLMDARLDHQRWIESGRRTQETLCVVKELFEALPLAEKQRVLAKLDEVGGMPLGPLETRVLGSLIELMHELRRAPTPEELAVRARLFGSDTASAATHARTYLSRLETKGWIDRFKKNDWRYLRVVACADGSAPPPSIDPPPAEALSEQEKSLLAFIVEHPCASNQQIAAHLGVGRQRVAAILTELALRGRIDRAVRGNTRSISVAVERSVCVRPTLGPKEARVHQAILEVCGVDGCAHSDDVARVLGLTREAVRAKLRILVSKEWIVLVCRGDWSRVRPLAASEAA